MSGEGYRFRLIDIMALMTLFGILLAFLLPALHGTRDPSRRTECAARLGELVKAMQMFEIAKNRYPGYLEAMGTNASGSCKVGTWAVVLLPYIEQEPLYDAWQDPSTTATWNSAGGFSSSRLAQDFYPSISLFRCASDSMSAEKLAPNSFACNAGFFPDVLPSSYTGMNPHEIAQRSSDSTNGVFSNQLPATVTTCYTGGIPMPILGSRAAQPTRSKDIKDGLTQTIAFSENLQADSWAMLGNRGAGRRRPSAAPSTLATT